MSLDKKIELKEREQGELVHYRFQKELEIFEDPGGLLHMMFEQREVTRRSRLCLLLVWKVQFKPRII